MSLFIIVLVYYLFIVPPPKHQNLYFTKIILKASIYKKKENLSFHKMQNNIIFSSFACNKILGQLHLLYIFIQIVSEYLTHVLAFTLKQRVCLCGRTVSTIICKCLLSGYVYCPVLLQSNPEVVSIFAEYLFSPSGTKGHIKFSRMFVLERSVSLCCLRNYCLRLQVRINHCTQFFLVHCTVDVNMWWKWRHSLNHGIKTTFKQAFFLSLSSDKRTQKQQQ